MSSEETQIPVPDDSSGLCPEEAKVDERLEVVKFLDTFKPTDLEKDPLPIKVHRSRITLDEMEGQAVQWAFEYLYFHACPMGLLQATLGQVYKHVRKYLGPKNDSQPDKISSQEMEPLQLMREVVGVVDNYLGKVSQQSTSLDISDMDAIRDLEAGNTKVTYSPEVFEVSYFSMKNARRTMEDKMAVFPALPHVFEHLRPVWDLSYFGVFDGHGGIEAASYGAAQLHQYFIRGLDEGMELVDALTAAFTRTDAAFISKCAEEKIRSGSAIVSVVVHGHKLYFAWAGDCQATLHMSNGKVKQLVTRHHPGREDEKQRIREMGGEVIEMGGVTRVNGTLAVARAIGDPDFKEYVISNPEVVEVDRSEDLNEAYIVIGSDGLWDKISPLEVGDFVGDFIAKNEGAKAAQLLANQAKSNGSQDNICIIVVYLKPLSDLMKRCMQPSSMFDGEIGKHYDTYVHTKHNRNCENGAESNAEDVAMFTLDPSSQLDLQDEDDDDESSDDDDDEWSFHGNVVPSKNDEEDLIKISPSEHQNLGKPEDMKVDNQNFVDISSLEDNFFLETHQLPSTTGPLRQSENETKNDNDLVQIGDHFVVDKIVKTNNNDVEAVVNVLEGDLILINENEAGGGVGETVGQNLAALQNGSYVGIHNFMSNGHSHEINDLTATQNQESNVTINGNSQTSKDIAEQCVDDSIVIKTESLRTKNEVNKEHKSIGNSTKPQTPSAPSKKILSNVVQKKTLATAPPKRPLLVPQSSKQPLSKMNLPKPAAAQKPNVVDVLPSSTLPKIPKPESKIREQGVRNPTQKIPPTMHPAPKPKAVGATPANKTGGGLKPRPTTNYLPATKPVVNCTQTKLNPSVSTVSTMPRKLATVTSSSSARPISNTRTTTTTVTSTISKTGLVSKASTARPLQNTEKTTTTVSSRLRPSPAVAGIAKVPPPSKPSSRPPTSTLPKASTRPAVPATNAVGNSTKITKTTSITGRPVPVSTTSSKVAPGVKKLATTTSTVTKSTIQGRTKPETKKPTNPQPPKAITLPSKGQEPLSPKILNDGVSSKETDEVGKPEILNNAELLSKELDLEPITRTTNNDPPGHS